MKRVRRRPRASPMRVGKTLLCVAIWGERLRGGAAFEFGCCPTFIAKTSCSGHGGCSSSCVCKCDVGWMEADCSFRECPKGRAWTDVAAGVDSAHALAECSNMGNCERTSGQCICREGYTGVACERMGCPGSEAGVSCSGHGRCLSMRYHAIDRTLGDHSAGYLANFQYSDVWDADKIHGCVCDVGFAGRSCALRDCPFGDDPLTGSGADLLTTGGGSLANEQFNSVQVLTCQADGGTFVLCFRGECSEQLEFFDSAEIFNIKLTRMSSIRAVSAIYEGVNPSACKKDAANKITITFTQNFGPLPTLVPMTAKLTSTDPVNRPVLMKIEHTVKGTKENMYCANRGICDVTTGVCTCAIGYTASDGYGKAGTDIINRGDCGHYGGLAVSSCPGEVPCSGHGICSNTPQFRCYCQAGWMGADCTEMRCPFGQSWFDVPSAEGKAHGNAECSDMGLCDRSKGGCECQLGFEGGACERIACPEVGSFACSGHGSCLTMFDLAQTATVNGGDAAGFTYGADPTERTTWDGKSLQGCRCDGGWTGYDCSLRLCAFGNDPRTYYDAFERQALTCTGVANTTFALTFRQATTAALYGNSTEADVKAALEGLGTVTEVRVNFTKKHAAAVANAAASGMVRAQALRAADVACDAAGENVVVVEFRQEFGDLPALKHSVTSALGSMAIETDGAGLYSVRGTKDNKECSGRGWCDRVTGDCRCYDGYMSSNGNNEPGRRGDCGFIISDLAAGQ